LLEAKRAYPEHIPAVRSKSPMCDPNGQGHSSDEVADLDSDSKVHRAASPLFRHDPPLTPLLDPGAGISLITPK
jgi:hypothetical protein